MRKMYLRIKFLELFEKIKKKKRFFNFLIGGCFWRALSIYLKKNINDTLSNLHQPSKVNFASQKHYSCWSSLTGTFQTILKRVIEKQPTKICRASKSKCFKIATNGIFGVIFYKKFQGGEYRSKSSQRCSSYIFRSEIWPNPIFL